MGKNAKLWYSHLAKLYEKQTNDHVVYQYLCTQAGCNSVKYIGYTTCHLAKRFYSHVQLGSINNHNKNVHNKKPFTKELLKDTSILYRGKEKNDLTIAEALLIKTHKPSLNLQEQGFTRILSIFWLPSRFYHSFNILINF